MKKLFFLCAFLFMSMQIQAQLYIVLVDNTIGNLQSKVTIVSPDGSTSEQLIPEAYGTSAADHYGPLNIILNDIISEGYKLIYTNVGATDGSPITHTQADKIYYLAAP